MSDIKFAKTIRIAVSDDVRLTQLEMDIIDTSMFQRLRQIKQLGPSAWVYPTAVHTRFDHSLGVLHAVDQMVQAIGEARLHGPADQAHPGEPITVGQRKLARLYGLLHDVTHVPFGHTLEDELRVFGSHDAFQDDGRPSERFEIPLGRDSEIGRLILEREGEAFYQRFVNVFLRGKTDRLPAAEDGVETYDEFVYYLVSDTVCADLIDYLQRDSHFCNLGLRAPVRILNYLYVADIEVAGQTLRRVVIRLWKNRSKTDGEGKPRRDLLTDLAGLLDARYMLAERVYFHPAKLIVAAMLGRSALEAVRAGALNERRMMEFGDETFVHHLRTLASNPMLADADDETALHAGIAARLADEVARRRLFKRVKRYHREDFDEPPEDALPAQEVLHKLMHEGEDRALQEDEIADLVGARPGDVLIYVGPRKMNMKVAEAIIDWRGARKKLSDLTTADDEVLPRRLQSIQQSHLRLWVVDLLVHPDLSAEKRQVAASAFEAKFLPRKDRRAKWVDVLHYLTEEEAALGNYTRPQVSKACREVASELAHKEPTEVPAHGQSAKERLVALVRERIATERG